MFSLSPVEWNRWEITTWMDDSPDRLNLSMGKLPAVAHSN